MSDVNFASLNPALLARKGGAKPAMRPQVGPSAAASHNADLEDLGWNDMGFDAANEADETVSIAPVNGDNARAGITSPARKQQEQVAARINSKPVEESASKERRPAFTQGKRAAFTLRLDADRHLRLRLAATIQGVSAQALVTQALDAHLSQIDDLEALASKIAKS